MHNRNGYGPIKLALRLKLSGVDANKLLDFIWIDFLIRKKEFFVFQIHKNYIIYERRCRS